MAVGLLVAALIAWVIDRYQEHQRKIRECVASGGHYFEYVSAWNEGKLWQRRCTRCPYQEPSGPPEEGEE